MEDRRTVGTAANELKKELMFYYKEKLRRIKEQNIQDYIYNRKK
jgi:hypothetical protein